MEQVLRHSKVHWALNKCLHMRQVKNLKLQMDNLMKMIELLMSALIADNTQVAVEVCEKIIFEISQWRRVQKMTCLSRFLILL